MHHLPSPHDVPKNPHVRRPWIIYRLRLVGSSLSAIAGEEGVVQQAVSAALINPNVNLETAIAKKLGLTPRDLFPERYDDEGNRLPAISTKRRNTSLASRERSKAGSR